jgi:hypothetical protein
MTHTAPKPPMIGPPTPAGTVSTTRFVRGCDPAQRVLPGMAVLRLHVAQKEELYISLGEGARRAGRRRHGRRGRLTGGRTERQPGEGVGEGAGVGVGEGARDGAALGLGIGALPPVLEAARPMRVRPSTRA